MSADTFPGTSTTVRRLPMAGQVWPALVAQAKVQFGWQDDTGVFVYLETATDCTLVAQRLDEAAPLGVLLEGRVFNAAGEVRWVAREDGLFDAWLVDERGGEPASCLDRDYFLIGRGVVTGGNTFAEGRYPGKTFTYPTTVSQADPASARAFVSVREYFKPAPADWDQVNDAQALQVLNEPMLIEHRFVGVGGA